MVEFSDFIEDKNLMDPQLEGGTITWFKGDNFRSASRIDRIIESQYLKSGMACSDISNRSYFRD